MVEEYSSSRGGMGRVGLGWIRLPRHITPDACKVRAKIANNGIFFWLCERRGTTACGGDMNSYLIMTHTPLCG